MDISLVLRDIVGRPILLKSPCLLLLCDYRGVCVCLSSPTVTKTLDTNCIKLRILGSNWLVIVPLEMLLDNADDPNTNKLIKCLVTQF